MYGDLANLGGRFTFTRGRKPSICQLTVVGNTFNLDRRGETLQLFYGSQQMNFPDAQIVGYHSRPRDTRNPPLWIVNIADRRWKWRYPRIDGVYNERIFGNRRSLNEKNARQLVDLCLDALGETGYDTSVVSTAVYPPVVWNRARADLELEWLCDLLGLEIVLKQSDNKVKIVKLNDTAGQDLPVLPLLSEDRFGLRSGVIPQNLRVQGDPTIIQSTLTLSAVGLETNGAIEGINSLSYTPGGGWTNEWYETFPNVSSANRHLAFLSVGRWWRPSSGWDGDGVTINNVNQLELLPWSAESVADDNGNLRPLPPRVTGVFWPQTDDFLNTGSGTPYAGDFRIIPEMGIVEFAHPVWASSAGPPSGIALTCAYRVRKPNHDGYSVYTRDKAVSKSNETTSHRVLCHPELTKVKIVDGIYGGATDNLTALNAEADAYLNGIEATYDYDYSRDAIYATWLKKDLDGALSQIEWWATEHLPAQTRIGRFSEFDLKTQQRSQERALRKLGQMAERMSL